MLTTLLAASALALIQGEKWTLTQNLTKDRVDVWTMSVKIELMGESHEATLRSEQRIVSTSEKEVKGTLSWLDILMDGEPVGEDVVMPITLSPRGAYVKVDHEMGDDMRRMLMPMAFVAPETAVGPGDKWEYEFKQSGSGETLQVNYVYEAKAVEKIGEIPVLRITGTVKEKSPEAISATTTHWLAKDGRVLKFEVDVKNWVVPMAGEQPFDAKITGTLDQKR